MPRCICEKNQLPSFDNKVLNSDESACVCSEYTIHVECRYCKGFNVFTWDSSGRKLPPRTHEEFWETAIAYNKGLKVELEARLKSYMEKQALLQEQLSQESGLKGLETPQQYDSGKNGKDREELDVLSRVKDIKGRGYEHQLHSLNRHIQKVLIDINTCEGLMQKRH